MSVGRSVARQVGPHAGGVCLVDDEYVRHLRLGSQRVPALVAYRARTART